MFCSDILRGEFGFEGVLMTDFGNDSDHVKGLAAGHDLKMSFGDPKRVYEAMENGLLFRERVLESARRVLRLILDTAGRAK